jgi:uncharacterized protein (TIGR02996 family)
MSGQPEDRHDHDGFLLSIHDRPTDDTPRLIYADWLEERGDIPSQAWAELIRIQIERARLKNRSPARRAALEARAQGLIAAHQPGWLGSWANVPFRWVYQRGMPQAIESRAQGWWIGTRLGADFGFPDRIDFDGAGRVAVHYGDINWPGAWEPFEGRYLVRFCFARVAFEIELWQVQRAALYFDGVLQAPRPWGVELLLQERAAPGGQGQQTRLSLRGPLV